MCDGEIKTDGDREISLKAATGNKSSAAEGEREKKTAIKKKWYSDTGETFV